MEGLVQLNSRRRRPTISYAVRIRGVKYRTKYRNPVNQLTLLYVWGSPKDPTTAVVKFMQRNAIYTVEDSPHWSRSSNMFQKSSIYNDSARMLWIDKICLHFDRCGKNHRRNVRLGLPFSTWPGFM
jgi:hypothetical protein